MAALGGAHAQERAPSNRPRVAVIMNVYFPNSHADVFVGRLLEGYRLNGRSYRPRAERDRAVLICVGEVTNQRGWERIARGGLEIHLLPARATAHRHDPVVQEPYADDIARLLRKL